MMATSEKISAIEPLSCNIVIVMWETIPYGVPCTACIIYCDVTNYISTAERRFIKLLRTILSYCQAFFCN